MADQVTEAKTAAAEKAAGNHDVGVNADEPSSADKGQDRCAPDPVTGDTEHHAGQAHAADNASNEPPA
ncbi:hypothetical protein GIS00_26620 [Nakamurella sp. YIM 132087]|uniref:Uncharacterized protein n=1 Tax=Nakamurella alba TaxID=2665158 RepID=A0A7K1FTK8_9ACTN|nr:hypothetical protein [Nakamurella alba]MTD17507.1 hypothetical protein [Nakamurella alba]